jgi:hypothetical protein
MSTPHAALPGKGNNPRVRHAEVGKQSRIDGALAAQLM